MSGSAGRRRRGSSAAAARAVADGRGFAVAGWSAVVLGDVLFLVAV